MDDRWVTIKTFDSPLEANLAKNLLEEAGLRTLLVGEEAVGMTWMLSNAVGGIRLQVVADDVARAQEILRRSSRAAFANDLEPEKTDDTGQSEIETDEPSDLGLEQPEEIEPETTDRAKNAERAFRGAVLGILFFPLQL
jgi:hypothetical protein